MISVLLACTIAFQAGSPTTPVKPPAKPKEHQAPRHRVEPPRPRQHAAPPKPAEQKPKPPYVDKPTGYGSPVAVGDTVTIHFLVKKQTGEEVANSKKRGLPYTFKIGAAGNDPLLDLVVKGMKVGAVRTYTISAKDAYGPGGAPPVISPKDMLVATVTLLRRGDR
ncbi:MAG TPA: FKBP-type peptidyl-prolyl cis-trans isomerase [Fimbriimonadaceae bacterium]|nr:FKBP-type peptidyl-prolyl cis-trans isomerase [Fimbriimonadaceae bacterium]